MLDIEQAELLLATFEKLETEFSVNDNNKNIDESTLPLLDTVVAKKLLEDFKELPTPPERRKAFLEIVGLSRLEAISSKALAFFFNTNEAHGLNDLALQALLSCLLKSNPDVKTGEVITTLNVEMEVTTQNGSRIDLVVETANELIIIENKIYHNANNPFDDYIEYGKERRGDKVGHYIVLGLERPTEKIRDTFYFISHFDLGNTIRQGLGNYITEANQYYVNSLIDYLQAIDALNPNTGIGKMEQAIVNFLANNHAQIEALYEAREHFMEYAEQNLEIVNVGLIESGINMRFKVTEVDIYPYFVGATLYSDDIVNHKTAIANDTIYYFYLGCYTSGVHLAIERRKNISGGRAYADTLRRLKEILDELQLEYDDMEDFADDAEYVIIKKLKWDASPEDIVTEFLPALKKIESALNLDKES